MCRSIHTLYNFEPPATEEEVRAAALQYVRKISGFTNPSQASTTPRHASTWLTSASPKDREHEAAKARARRAQQQAA